MSNNPLQTEDRKPLTPRQRIDMLIEQGGRCKSCGHKFEVGERIVDEHVIPLWAGGTNKPENRELWCGQCAQAKTDKETTERAEANRKGGRRGSQYHRRATKKAAGKSPWPDQKGKLKGAKKIPSRQFPKGRSFDGSPRPKT